MRCDYIINHVPGKSLHTADALSQAPLLVCHISTVVDTLPVSSTRLTSITQDQADDPVCSTLISYCSAG